MATSASTTRATFTYTFPTFHENINYTGNLTIPSASTTDLGSTPLTVGSLQVPSFVYVTFFDKEKFTGNTLTFSADTKTITNGTTNVYSYIIQNSLVPYTNVSTSDATQKSNILERYKFIRG